MAVDFLFTAQLVIPFISMVNSQIWVFDTLVTFNTRALLITSPSFKDLTRIQSAPHLWFSYSIIIHFFPGLIADSVSSPCPPHKGACPESVHRPVLSSLCIPALGSLTSHSCRAYTADSKGILLSLTVILTCWLQFSCL